MAKNIKGSVYLFNGKLFIVDDWVPENEHQQCIENEENATVISAEYDIDDAFIIFGKILVICNFNVYHVEYDGAPSTRWNNYDGVVYDEHSIWHLLVSDITHYKHFCIEEFDNDYNEIDLLVVIKDEKKYIYGIYECKRLANLYPKFTLMPKFIEESQHCNMGFPTKRIKSAV